MLYMALRSYHNSCAQSQVTDPTRPHHTKHQTATNHERYQTQQHEVQTAMVVINTTDKLTNKPQAGSRVRH